MQTSFLETAQGDFWLCWLVMLIPSYSPSGAIFFFLKTLLSRMTRVMGEWNVFLVRWLLKAQRRRSVATSDWHQRDFLFQSQQSKSWARQQPLEELQLLRPPVPASLPYLRETGGAEVSLWFCSWGVEMAWWIGVLLGDVEIMGCVRWPRQRCSAKVWYWKWIFKNNFCTAWTSQGKKKQRFDFTIYKVLEVRVQTCLAFGFTASNWTEPNCPGMKLTAFTLHWELNESQS